MGASFASSPLTSQRKTPQSLREYQRELAERTRSAQSARIGPCRQLGFMAAGQGWLIDLGDASEIMPVPPVTRVPGTQPWFLGLLNHRGRLIGVVDYTRFIGHPPSPPKNSDRLIVLSDRFSLPCALLVSAVSGLLDLSAPEDAEAPGLQATSGLRPWEGALMRSRGKPWRRLELQTLVTDGRFANAALKSPNPSFQSLESMA